MLLRAQRSGWRSRTSAKKKSRPSGQFSQAARSPAARRMWRSSASLPHRHFAALRRDVRQWDVALTAMLLAEGIGPGDEVIVPSMTFISSATAVRHVGATPVFADIDPRSFNLDPGEIPGSPPQDQGRHHRALRRPARELDELLKACGHHGLLALEDAAQAAGADFGGTPVGTFGRSAMFSFTPTKNITMGEGGIVLTSERRPAERLRLLRNHGQRHPYEHVLIGYNWRLTEIQAAIGRVQLRKLDAILARKRANADWMSRRLAGIPGITPPYQLPHARSVTCSTPAWWTRPGWRARAPAAGASKRGSISRPPISSRFSPGSAQSLPVTEAIAAKMLSIPMHSRLPPSPIADTIADAVEDGASGQPGGPVRPAAGRRRRPGHHGPQPCPGAGRPSRRRAGRRRPTRSRGRGGRHGRSRSSADLDALLALGIDMCVVASPTLTHADVGLRLADAGVHALIEKPLASDPESGRLLAKAFEERGLVGAVGHIERYNPAVQRASGAARAGRSGIGVPGHDAPPRAIPAADPRCRRRDGSRHP